MIDPKNNLPDEMSDDPSTLNDELNRLVDIFEEDSNTRRITPEQLAAIHEASKAEEVPVEIDEEPDDELDDIEERDYRPIRFSRSGRLGCLGGLMYAVFIICLSVVLACAGWMAACDVLALNKEEATAVIEIPEDSFIEKEVDIYDEDGEVIGRETLLVADIDYVSRALKDSGIIEYPALFKLFAMLSSADEKINPGSYSLSSRYDYRAIVKNLEYSTAERETTKITFPEGYTMAQIFEKLEEENVCSAQSLYDAAANYDFKFEFLDESTIGDDSRLEGYIFPDTYDFYIGEQPSSVISKFLNAFHSKVASDPDISKQCENLGISFYEAITIASMIEKEAADSFERGKIASVIYNRLNANMTLGIDATILYIHPEYDGGVDIPQDILSEDSPYNTHIYTGLTPTPICNPGLESIRAALEPDSTDYYYYALDAETENHRFFTNYNEFLAFVETQDYGA